MSLDASPLAGQIVAVRGIVTAKRFNNGFFIQTPDAAAALEGDPMTSEGVFVFTSVAPSAVNVGDEVIVTGTVAEFTPSADPHQPPVTEIVTPTIAVQATGQPLPAAIALTAADLSPTGGPLQLERFEGMRVAPGMLTVVAPTSGSVNEPNGTGSNNGVFYTVFAGTPRPFREAGIDVLDPPPPCDENAAGAVRDSGVRRQPGTAARGQRRAGRRVPRRGRLVRRDDQHRRPVCWTMRSARGPCCPISARSRSSRRERRLKVSPRRVRPSIRSRA